MTLKHNESNLKSKKVVIRFLPDNVVVQAEVGKRLLDVALQAGQLKEHPLEPFCRDGGCYKCEMETSNKLFEEYPLIRTCKYTVPVVSEEIQLTKVDNDQLWGENMLTNEIPFLQLNRGKINYNCQRRCVGADLLLGLA
ncbi:hypothetical protein Gasu2_37430 [Galdieria sulphuraria]|nr:hypothetical protein Gasu2_37430 [Galdieria sulphuraria]